MDERDELIDFLHRQYRLVDAYWFLEVEKKFGLPAAVELNENVWEILGAKTAREIKRRFNIKEKGLKGFIKALKYYPWTKITGYVIDEQKNKIIITVPHCPPQEARIKNKLGEFPCKQMHLKDFSGFAKEIDEKIKTRCLFAPPDKHPQDCFCKWEFTLEE